MAHLLYFLDLNITENNPGYYRYGVTSNWKTRSRKANGSYLGVFFRNLKNVKFNPYIRMKEIYDDFLKNGKSENDFRNFICKENVKLFSFQKEIYPKIIESLLIQLISFSVTKGIINTYQNTREGDSIHNFDGNFFTEKGNFENYLVKNALSIKDVIDIHNKILDFAGLNKNFQGSEILFLQNLFLTLNKKVETMPKSNINDQIKKEFTMTLKIITDFMQNVPSGKALYLGVPSEWKKAQRGVAISMKNGILYMHRMAMATAAQYSSGDIFTPKPGSRGANSGAPSRSVLNLAEQVISNKTAKQKTANSSIKNNIEDVINRINEQKINSYKKEFQSRIISDEIAQQKAMHRLEIDTNR